MTKIYMILLISNMYVLEPYNIKFQAGLYCGDYGDKLREELSTYNEEHNFWRMNHGSGTWQGFICE